MVSPSLPSGELAARKALQTTDGGMSYEIMRGMAGHWPCPSDSERDGLGWARMTVETTRSSVCLPICLHLSPSLHPFLCMGTDGRWK